jgi:hypothetical protein
MHPHTRALTPPTPSLAHKRVVTVWLATVCLCVCVSVCLCVGSGASVIVNRNSLPASSTLNGTFDTHTVFWSVNPYSWSATTKQMAATVTTVELLDPETGMPFNLTAAAQPVVISVVVPSTVNQEEFRCNYWSHAVQDWSDAGTILVGFTAADDGTGRLIAHCATVHLSDFAAMQAPVSFFVVTDIDPVGDAGLLQQVVNPQNLLSLFVIVGVMIVFGTSWIVSYKHDEGRSRELEKLHRAHMVLFGEVRTGLGMHCLHLPLDHPARRRVVALYDQLKVRPYSCPLLPLPLPLAFFESRVYLTIIVTQCTLDAELGYG